MSFSITPMCLGRLIQPRSRLQSHEQETIIRENGQETVYTPCISWLLQGTSGNIIVDAGPPSCDFSEKHHWPLLRRKEETMAAALAAHGLTPKDIAFCICTHMHWDHVYGFEELPGIPIYVQKKELEYALHPLPVHDVPYEYSLGAPYMEFMHDRLVLLEGDMEVMPGIRLLLTPGHSPGSMSVLVDTAEGVYGIAGDNVNLYCCLEYDPPCYPTCVWNIPACYSSIRRVREASVHVLPCHDGKVLGQSYPGERRRAG